MWALKSYYHATNCPYLFLELKITLKAIVKSKTNSFKMFLRIIHLVITENYKNKFDLPTLYNYSQFWATADITNSNRMTLTTSQKMLRNVKFFRNRPQMSQKNSELKV